MTSSRPRGPRRSEAKHYSERALSERVAKLETHREYAATREDVSRLTAEVEKRFTELTAAVANINININMATKTWILGGVLALVIALATAAASAWFRTLFQL